MFNAYKGLIHLDFFHQLTVPVTYLKDYKPKLCKWLPVTIMMYGSFFTPDMASKTIPGMASGWTITDKSDAIPGIAFQRHVWRQKPFLRLPDSGVKMIHLKLEIPKLCKWLQGHKVC